MVHVVAAIMFMWYMVHLVPGVCRKLQGACGARHIGTWYLAHAVQGTWRRYTQCITIKNLPCVISKTSVYVLTFAFVHVFVV